MNTLLLDAVNWDFVLDSSGNIALATEPYAIAQDVASAARLFAGELWFDTTKGIPYFEQILGHSPPIAIYKALNEAAALTVPNVVKAKCYVSSYTDRKITGQIQTTDTSGTTTVTNI